MADQPEELTITLRKPVKFPPTDNGIIYDRLDLREPTAGEWLEWDKLSGIEADVKAVSVVAKIPEPAVKLIGARDLNQAARYIAGFLLDAPLTTDGS